MLSLLTWLLFLMSLFILSRASRIVGGHEVLPNSLPYTVSVQDELSTHFCGGAILSSEHVLTTGLCCVMASGMTVVGGEHNLYVIEGTEQVVDVSDVLLHEEFNDATLENDLCLLTLEFPLILNQAVSTVSLPSQGQSPSGSMGVVSGWGTLGGSAGAPDVLHAVDLRLLDDDECEDAYVTSDGPYDVYPELMICAGDPGNGVCKGDYGGPLVADGLLYGLASWADGCGNEFPAVFVEVANFVDWIEGHMDKDINFDDMGKTTGWKENLLYILFYIDSLTGVE